MAEPTTKSLPDLRPAEWIWFPSTRVLANTFVLFRREFSLRSAPVRAIGWIAADSRYRLEVNGERIQWGSAPSDPRWQEADPIDLTSVLTTGLNVLGATVLFYGHGEGTWAIGKPGFLFWLEIEYADGSTQENCLGCKHANTPMPCLAAGPIPALVPARLTGRIRCTPLSARLEPRGISARPRVASGDASRGFTQQAGDRDAFR